MSQFGRRNEPPEEKEKRLASLRAFRTVDIRDVEEVRDLPRWAKMGIARFEILGETWEEASKSVHHSPKSLSSYGNSPAGKKWRDEIQKVADDPKTISEALLRGTALDVTLDYLLAFQQAIDSSDYKETGVMARDLLDRIGITKKEQKRADVPSHIVINLPGGVSLEAPTGHAEFKALPGEVIIDAEIVESDG